MESARKGHLKADDMCSFVLSARLHEVPRISHHFRNPFTLLGPCVHPGQKRLSYDAPNPRNHHTLFEFSALTRHAGSIKRPPGTCALCSTSCATTRQLCKASPLNVDTPCAEPARTVRSSTCSMGRKSSSIWWQPSWPSFRSLCGNQVRWCFVSHPCRLSLPLHH